MRWRREGMRYRNFGSARPSYPGVNDRSRARDRRALLPFSWKPRLDPERGRINPDYPSSKWVITHNKHRRRLGKNRPACGVPHMKKSHAEIYVAARSGPSPSRSGLGRPFQTTLFWNCAMMPGILNRFSPVIRLLWTAALVPTLAYAAEQDRVQFCWAMGKFDHTIYYAEIENRED